MKLYLVAPTLPANADEAAVDARLRTCVEPIADLILSHLSADPALFAMRHANERSESPVQTDTNYGNAEVIRVNDSGILRKILLECGDPFSGRWMLVRSLVTCRAVSYGYDGQALVCLPTNAPPITSPEETLITVEECSHMLTETDWMDGLGQD